MNVEEWVRYCVDADAREESEEVDFTAIGTSLGKDAGLTQAQYEEVLSRIVEKLFGNQFATILDYCLEHRPFPREEFWVEAIAKAVDWEVGGKILSTLLPYVNLTDFVARLLAKVVDLPEKEHRRISFAVWVAACGVSLSIPTGDRFEMKEAVDTRRLAEEIRRWLPRFRQPYDRDSLETALRSIGG